MSHISHEDRKALREGFAKYLSEAADEDRLRAGIAADRGYDPAVWQQMAQMGLLGIAVSEELGGVGGGAIDVALVAEEMGRRLLPAPYISTCVVAAELIERFAPDTVKRDLLGQIAAGEIVIAMGGEGGFVPYSDAGHSLTAAQTGEGVTLSGEVSFVSHGGNAAYFLLAVKEAAEHSVYLVDASDAVSLTKLPSNDPAQRLFKLRLNNAPANRLVDTDTEGLAQVAMRAVAASAAEQAGAARAIFEITVEYMKIRYQFGRPIGSFQAMKHMAAELLLEVEAATSAALAAATALDAGSAKAPRMVSLAAFTCKDAFRTVSAQAIQMHGGIAYTEEHVAHLFWRRARAGLTLFGTSDEHRELYLQSRERAQ